MNVEPTIFVVDDDPSLRDSLCWLLGSINLNVRAFASAQEFLAAYDRSQPGCLVVDVCMPGITGIELQQMLSARGARLPVIVISGHSDAAMEMHATRAGACAFFEKPFDDRALLERVRQCLEADDRLRRMAAARQRKVDDSD